MNKMMNALILENFGDHEFTRVELPYTSTRGWASSSPYSC